MGRMEKNVEAIAALIAKDEERLNVEVKSKVELVKATHSAVRIIAKGEKVKVSMNLFNPFPSSGCVSVNGKRVVMTDPEVFAFACQNCHVFNIYPRTDGTVQIDLGYDGLKKEGDA